MRHTAKYLIKHYSFYLGGDQPPVTWTERFRSSCGAFIGLVLVLTIARYLGELSGLDEWLMASLGASALLVFALPGSPMAQPWAVIAGNTLSASIGITAANLIKEPLLAMPIAAALSILGDVRIALFASPSGSRGINCSSRPRDELPICHIPSDD